MATELGRLGVLAIAILPRNVPHPKLSKDKVPTCGPHEVLSILPCAAGLGKVVYLGGGGKRVLHESLSGPCFLLSKTQGEGEGEGQVLAMTEGSPTATLLGTPTILANCEGQASVF